MLSNREKILSNWKANIHLDPDKSDLKCRKALDFNSVNPLYFFVALDICNFELSIMYFKVQLLACSWQNSHRSLREIFQPFDYRQGGVEINYPATSIQAPTVRCTPLWRGGKEGRLSGWRGAYPQLSIRFTRCWSPSI